MHARSTLAIIHVHLTVIAFEACIRAVTLVRVDAINAHAIVQTRRRLGTKNFLHQKTLHHNIKL